MTGVDEAPSLGSGLDDRLRALSPERRALLAQRLGVGGSLIVPVPRTDAPELTTVQRRLWILERLDPGYAVAYNVPRVVRVRGEFDEAAFAAAVTAVVARHDVLRTRIDDVGGEPTARVAAASAIHVPVVEVPVAGGGPALEQALALAAQEVARPFQLDAEDLLRATVLRLAADDHLLVLTTHHIAADEGSRALLLRDLAVAYDAALGGAPSSSLLPARPALQYADYAAWEGSNADAVDAAVAYWATTLAGAPDLIDLPTDRPRPPVRDHDGRRIVRELPADLAVGVQQLARRSGATTFAVLLAGFAALLHRLSGQDEVVIGVPVSGRTLPELTEMIGCFANTVALRLEVVSEESFADLAGRAREVTSSALAHNAAPFDRVVDALRAPRDTSRTPVFQVCFNHVAAAADVPNFGAATAEGVEVNPGVAKFDLTLVSREDAGAIRLLWEFTTDLFDSATVEAWHDQLVTLLAAAVADPAAQVGALPLLEAAEIERLRAALADSASPIKGETVLGLFDERVRRTPDVAAVVDESSSLTYQQLDAASADVARRLAALGVGTGSLVGVCLERSVGMLVALLGVLKAGAAYVPLDPAFPVDRLHFMLADSDCGVVVTQSSLTGLVGAGRRVLLLDALDDLDALDALDDTVPPAGVTDLAYVIYTSGSTGVPKGVLIEHGALSNFLQSMAAEPGCAAGDVLVAVTTLSFDIAALELFLPLVTGATVVIVRRETATDPAALAAALKRHGATIMQATPSTWRMLVDDGWAGRPGLRMLCGGEALPATLAGALLPLGRELWNMYGPTETTIWSSVDHVRPGRPIRLGRPVLNTDLLVVDGHRQPVPAGVAGELLIGGLGLARGYHNRAELTADRFVEHPLAPGARAYRTGDLVRTRRDGEIEFLGRMDHQVKVRGFRIELGEVEVAIAAHPAVRDVVVVVREDVPGDQLLVGYAVGDVDGPELRAFVGTRLPSYMVPSVIMVLDELPRTSNGKTDRKGLPAPEIAVASAAEFVAPRGPVEEAVADMWCTVLRLDQVSVLDDFFTVGGHSLRIAQVLSRVRQTFGVDLTLHEVYERPTVAAMAQAITLRLIDDPELAELMAQVEGTDGSDA